MTHPHGYYPLSPVKPTEPDSSFENLAYLATVLLNIPAADSHTGLVRPILMFCVALASQQKAILAVLPGLS